MSMLCAWGRKHLARAAGNDAAPSEIMWHPPMHDRHILSHLDGHPIRLGHTDP